MSDKYGHSYVLDGSHWDCLYNSLGSVHLDSELEPRRSGLTKQVAFEGVEFSLATLVGSAQRQSAVFAQARPVDRQEAFHARRTGVVIGPHHRRLVH